MNRFALIYEKLLSHYGEQHWWPAASPFEVMVGAILTQNTSWPGVERAIENLQRTHMLSPRAIIEAAIDELAEQLKPSGYFNIKAQRLSNYCRWYLEQGELDRLKQLSTETLRHGLLSVNGVGPETADDILLYAFNRPIFVIDAYTRRLFSRLGYIDGSEGYEPLRKRFETQFEEGITEVERTGLFNEYHALIVIHAKEHCRKRAICDGCPVAQCCRSAGLED